jgi:glutamate N-acetyltransferase/amino-acid N-acetyltransferase
MIRIINQAVLPKAFLASGLAAGIKKSGKLDLALFYSQTPAKAAALFTTNKIVAAPLIVCKKYLQHNKNFRAIVVNSGNANCFTGQAGIGDAQKMSALTAKALVVKNQEVLVSSTGVINKRLPMEKIRNSIPALARSLSDNGIDQAKAAIMTTDTFAKEKTARFSIGGKTVTICGVAKGAGMIAPTMATMLSFILTDAAITQKALQKALSMCVERSFNCITVDGCMSTNDSVIILANGAAGNKVIDKGANFDTFVNALYAICLDLAKMCVQDGEGATKFIEIKVSAAKNADDARRAALAIANSNLFKTAVFGENQNFGRIAAAVGASGASVSEIDLKFKVSPLKKRNVYVQVYLGKGKSSATVYTSDLTPEYIKINAEYN